MSALPPLRGLEALAERNVHYRHSYGLILQVVFLQLAAILILIWALVTTIQRHGPRDLYFPVTDWGDIMPRPPLSLPYVRYFDRKYNPNSPNAGDWLGGHMGTDEKSRKENEAALLAWAEDAVRETLTFHHLDDRMRLQEASEHFTPEGWKSFYKALSETPQSLLMQIRGTDRLLRTEVIELPRIVKSGFNEYYGAYAWRIRMRAQVNYLGRKEVKIETFDIELTVQRVGTSFNPRAVAIAQWTADKVSK